MDKDNKEKALLSILITTYNRAPVLDKQLEILKSYEDAGLCFELVVSNDCSSDNTDEVCQKWKDKFRKMKYICLTERSGMDKNFVSVYEAFETEYCWLLGDHRMINFEGLKKVIEKLSEHENDAYILNCDELMTVEDKVYTDINDLFYEQGWHITNNASCVIPKYFIKKELYYRYFTATFLHLGIFLDNLCYMGSFKVCYMKEAMVRGLSVENYSGVGWTCHPFHNFGGWWVMFVFSLPCQISLDTKLKVLKDQQRVVKYHSVKKMLRGRYVYGDIYVNSYKENRRFMRFVSDVPLWLSDLILYFPKPLFNLAKNLYVGLIKRGRVKRTNYTDASSTSLH